MPVSIRTATTADARGIAEVHVRGWQIGFAEYFSAEYLGALSIDQREVRWREWMVQELVESVLVAIDRQRIAGFVSYGLNRSELEDAVGESYALYVDTDCWGCGIGTQLIEAAEAGLADGGFERAILWTLGPNQRTRAFYEHRGWRFDGATKPHPTGVELVRYAKELRSARSAPLASA